MDAFPKAVLVLLLGGLALGPLEAQVPEGPRALRLRRELEQRFAEQLRTQLQLSDEQSTNVGAILSASAERRRDLEAGERQLRTALAGQLRPGIAANPDSLNRLLDGLAQTRVDYARVMQDEMKELATVLTPVQRGQLFLMRDRLLQRVQEMREQARLRGGRPPLG